MIIIKLFTWLKNWIIVCIIIEDKIDTEIKSPLGWCFVNFSYAPVLEINIAIGNMINKSEAKNWKSDK